MNDHRFVLTEAITVFAFFTYQRGVKGCGSVCEIPRGASLEVCGPGFSERTLKARYGNSYYHVFCRDLCRSAKMHQDVDPEDLGRLVFQAHTRTAA